MRNLEGVLIAKEISVLGCSAKLKDVFWGKQTIKLSPTIENFGKLSVLSSRSRLFTKNPLFSIIATKLLVIMRNQQEFLTNISAKLWKTQIQTKLWTVIQQAQTLPILCLMLLKSSKIIQVQKKIKHFMSGKDLQLSFNFQTKNKILAEIHNLDKKESLSRK